MNETDSTQQLDVLYENQRGITICGAVYFSGKSLLNFDPAPWVDGNSKASPVNIKTATCPDPSWEWDSLSAPWTWKGNSRYLGLATLTEYRRDDPRLMTDYFTISSSYAVHKSPTHTQQNESLSCITDEDEEEISTIPSLLHALQNSRIDREKLDSLRKFLQSASVTDKKYLINMKEKVLKSFVYEYSCRLAKEMLNERSTRHVNSEKSSFDLENDAIG